VGCALFLIWFLVTAIGGRTKPEFCFLPGRLRWTLFPRSATAIHSVVVVRTPNLPVGRRTPYQWAVAGLCSNNLKDWTNSKQKADISHDFEDLAFAEELLNSLRRWPQVVPKQEKPFEWLGDNNLLVPWTDPTARFKCRFSPLIWPSVWLSFNACDIAAAAIRPFRFFSCLAVSEQLLRFSNSKLNATWPTAIRRQKQQQLDVILWITASNAHQHAFNQ